MQILRLYGILSPVVLGTVVGCNCGVVSGALLVQILLLSGRVSAAVLGSFRLQFRCCFGCISGVDSTTSGLVSPAVLGEFSAVILVQLLVHLWCRFCDFTVYFLRLF